MGKQFTTKEVLLYFEDESKCKYVKNMLEHTKKNYKICQINKVHNFLDKHLKEINNWLKTRLDPWLWDNINLRQIN